MSKFGRGSIEFVENREAQGCFGADVEALTGVDQDDVHRALSASGLYTPEEGVQIAPASLLNDSMRNGGSIPVAFGEALPFFNGFEGDEIALDDSPDIVRGRLLTLANTLEEDDNSGIILFYPCQRPANPRIFGHFVAVVEPQETEAALTVMDPSELRNPDTQQRIGGVFQKTEEEMLAMLTPNNESMIPILAYTVRVNPVPETSFEAEAGAEAEIEIGSKLPLVGAVA